MTFSLCHNICYATLFFFRRRRRRRIVIWSCVEGYIDDVSPANKYPFFCTNFPARIGRASEPFYGSEELKVLL